MIIRDNQITFSIAWFKRLLVFLLEAVIVLSIVIFGINFLNAMPDPAKPVNSSDSIAIANTFTVFVTFIFVVFTVFVTLAGLYFSRWWSREKKQVLSENWSEMIEEIKKDDKLMRRLKEDLLSESLEEMMKSHLEEHKKVIENDTKTKLKKVEVFLKKVIQDPTQNSVLDQQHVDEISQILEGGR